MSRPGVVMLTQARVPFGDDWARAVGEHVDLFVVRTGNTAFSPPPISNAVSAYTLDLPRLRPKRFFASILARMWVDQMAAIVRSIEREYRPVDILHGHFYPVGGLLQGFSSRHGYPFVLTEHSSRLTGESAAHKPLSKAGLKTARRAFEGAAVVCCVSNYLRRCIDRLGLAGRFLVVGNPVDISIFNPSFRSAGRGRVLWVGRLESDKDPIAAIGGFLAARRINPGIHLDVVGTGPDQQRVASYLADHGAGEGVTLHGRVSRTDIARLLRQSDVFLSSSRVETFGLAVAEALAAGVPAVVPDIPALRELVNESNGALYAPGNVDELAAALVSTIRDRERFPAKEVAQSVRARLGAEVVGASVASIYSDVLTGSLPTVIPSGSFIRPIEQRQSVVGV